MGRLSKSRMILCIKSHKAIVIVSVLILIIIIIVNVGPKTIAYGNGYLHQVGKFGKCDMNFDDCIGKATHRRHHYFGNEDYCEACWEGYGQIMFDGLSASKSGTSVLSYDEFGCRYIGCDKKAKYSDWDRKFCAEHLQGTKYCLYPYCGEQIPIDGWRDYCRKHG